MNASRWVGALCFLKNALGCRIPAVSGCGFLNSGYGIGESRQGVWFVRLDSNDHSLGRAERFLSTQADHLAGARWKEKASACSVRNDGGGRGRGDQNGRARPLTLRIPLRVKEGGYKIGGGAG
jgi:hypothetical protein